MQTDFWNNPLVINAFRVKYRQGAPGVSCAGYLLLLLGIGALLHYNSLHLSMPFGRAYLLAIFTLQAGLSAVIAMLTVGASINNEVLNRTLDFQRIVALSPRDILLGKMIGEPLIVYFLLLTTVPLAVICWSLGGGSALVIALIYVNLLSFTLLAAAGGTLNSLTAPAEKGGKQQSGFGWVLFVGLFWGVPWAMRVGTSGLEEPWLGSILGLLTPLSILMHLYDGNPLNANVPFFAYDVPALVAAPFAQLLAAGWLMQLMARRLKNNLDPPLSKRGSYKTLAVLDLWYVSICYHAWTEQASVASLVYQFMLAHVLTCLLLMLMATPQRPALMAWIWRRRGRAPKWPERLLGERSPSTWLGLIYALIGTTILLGGLWGPIRTLALGGDVSKVWEAVGYGAVLVIALSLFHQWQTAAMGRVGNISFLLLSGVLAGIPLLAGAILQEAPLGRVPGGLIDAFIGVSPISLFAARIGEAQRFADRDHLQPLWLAGTYGLLAVFSCWGLLGWIRRRAQVVEKKLKVLNRAETGASGPLAERPYSTP